MSRLATLRDSSGFGLRSSIGFAKLLGGSLGRLVISLAYFVSIANTLSVADFGLFATAAATGIVLSRVAGLGFTSPLYRAATHKRRLIGTYTAALAVAFIASLPLVAVLAAAFHLVFFAGEMGVGAFATIILAEVAFWRTLEIVCIVNNGLGRFGRGAAALILGSGVRAAAALAFAAWGDATLSSWSAIYLAANAVAAVLAAGFWYPRVRLRLRRQVFAARWRDALSTGAAEVAFYLQSELDKLLVLALAGTYTAGLYAILMRLIDLTALPVRSANTLIVQRLMKSADWLSTWRTRWGLEAAVAVVSLGGLVAIGFLLHLDPQALGRNVADAAPLVLLALLVPAFRNLIEYEGELLYARGKTGSRLVILIFLAALKTGLMTLLLTTDAARASWVLGLNGVFATLWLASLACTYTAYDWEAKGTLRGALRPARARAASR